MTALTQHTPKACSGESCIRMTRSARHSRRGGTRPPTRMLSQWGVPKVFSLAFHPHGEHVSPLLDFFVMHRAGHDGHARRGGTRPPTRMLSQWGVPRVFSLAIHPHGERVSPLLDFLSCTERATMGNSGLWERRRVFAVKIIKRRGAWV